MPRATRIALWSAGAVVLLLAMLAGGALIGMNTQGGRALIEHWLPRLTSGRVRIYGLAGSLPRTVDLQRLEIADPQGVWLSADHIHVRWRPLQFIDWRIEIETLDASRVDIVRRPHYPPSAHPSSHPPRIPEIDAARVDVTAVALGQPLVGIPAILTVHGGMRMRSLEDASGQITARRTNGEGDYEVQLDFNRKRMDGRLHLKEPASGPLEHLLEVPGLGALDVEASITGPHDAAAVNLQGQVGTLSARLDGTLDVTHRTVRLNVAADSGPVAPRADLAWQRMRLQGRWTGGLERPQADGQLQLDGLQVPGQLQLASLAATLAASGGLLSVQATAGGVRIPGPHPELFADSPLRLEARWHLAEKRRPLQLSATHRLFVLQALAQTASPMGSTFTLQLPDVAPFAALVGKAIRGPAELKGKLAVESGTTRLTADASARLADGGAGIAQLLGDSTRLHVSASLDPEKLQIEQLQLTGRALLLAGAGTAERSPAGSAHLVGNVRARFELDASDLAALSPALGGALKLTGHAEGPLDALQASVQARTTLKIHDTGEGMLEANLQARGLPSHASGALQAHGRFDGSALQLSASLDRGAGGAFHLIVHHTDWKSLHVDGDLTSGAKLTQGKGTLQLRVDRLADFERLLGIPLAGRIQARVALEPTDHATNAHLQIEAIDVLVSHVLANVRLTGEGPVSALPVELSAQLPSVYGAPLSVTATARVDAADKRITLQRTEATYNGETAKLLKPARVELDGGLRVDDLRLGLHEALLHLDGQLSPVLDVRASLHRVDAAIVNRFVPKLLASGTLNAQLQLRGSRSAPEGRASLTIGSLRMAKGTARDLPLINLRADADLAAGAADVRAELKAGQASQLRLSGRAPLSRTGTLDLKLSGKLDTALSNPFLETRGERAAGELTIDASITGPASEPEIGGSVLYADGDLRDYAEGIHLSDVSARLLGSQGTLRIDSLSAKAGSGQMSATGSLGLLQPKIPISIEVTARNAQPITNDIVTANLNANLTVKGTLRERIDLVGTFDVNRAVIGVPNSLPANVAVLDVVRPGELPPTPTAPRLVIGLDLDIKAPRDILVQGRGLDAELGGDIKIHGTTAQPLVSGGFELIRGTLALASTQLSFTMGEVSFNGTGLKGRIDPTIDFTAQANVQDSTVTLHITGLADSPRFELTSSPQLPQDEILARLLFGQSAAQLSALQVAEIGAALATLTGIGGSGGGLNPLAKVQKALGLDRLSVGSAPATGPPGNTQNTGASISAGRYVTKRVYVGAMQSTTGTSQVQVDVDLTKHLKLQTRLGNGTAVQGTTPENDPGSSVGLSYQFEY